MKNKSNTNKVLIFIIVVLCVVVGVLLWLLIKNDVFRNDIFKNSSNVQTNTATEIDSNKDNTDKSNEVKVENNSDSNSDKTEDQKNEAKSAPKTENKSEQNNSQSKKETKPENNNTIPQTNQTSNSTNSKLIVIDPGHQVKGNSAQEPIGPGATQTKAKVTGGATGVATKQTEYALNLKVALLLQQKLQAKGYTVIMTRTSNDVNISNKERAEIANNANAAAFIRIHANSLNDQSVKGILTMCQTPNNQYNGYLADKSYKLSKLVLDNVVKSTGGISKGVTRTDSMSGINWCKVPTTIIEMGFLSNPEEDKLLATDAYQTKIVDGIVQGIEEFLK